MLSYCLQIQLNINGNVAVLPVGLSRQLERLIACRSEHGKTVLVTEIDVNFFSNARDMVERLSMSFPQEPAKNDQ